MRCAPQGGFTRSPWIVGEITAAKGAKPAQIALAWLLNKGEDIVPVAGTKRRTYLDENVAAAAIALDQPEIGALDEALGPGRITGPRNPEWLMATIDR